MSSATSNATDSKEKVAALRKLLTPELMTQAARTMFVLDAACLRRYLRAHKGDVAASFKGIVETVTWRDEFQPGEYNMDVLVEQTAMRKLYIRGHNKVGGPLLYMRPAREKRRTAHDDNVRYLVYTLERAIAEMDEGVERFTWIVSFRGFSLRNAPPLKTAKATIQVMATHFPERLENCLIVDAPRVFTVFWKLVSPFIDPITKKKIIFVPRAKQREVLSEYVNLADVEAEDFGGGLDEPFNPNSYLNLGSSPYPDKLTPLPTPAPGDEATGLDGTPRGLMGTPTPRTAEAMAELEREAADAEEAKTDSARVMGGVAPASAAANGESTATPASTASQDAAATMAAAVAVAAEAATPTAMPVSV